MYELGDALEHLRKLVKDIEFRPDYSDDDLRVDMRHVYAHLNRARWQSSKPFGWQRMGAGVAVSGWLDTRRLKSASQSGS